MHFSFFHATDLLSLHIQFILSYCTLMLLQSLLFALLHFFFAPLHSHLFCTPQLLSLYSSLRLLMTYTSAQLVYFSTSHFLNFNHSIFLHFPSLLYFTLILCMALRTALPHTGSLNKTATLKFVYCSQTVKWRKRGQSRGQ